MNHKKAEKATKDYDCGSIPRPQRPAFCIFMQLFIVDLSFEKSSTNYIVLITLFRVKIGSYQQKKLLAMQGVNNQWLYSHSIIAGGSVSKHTDNSIRDVLHKFLAIG